MMLPASSKPFALNVPGAYFTCHTSLEYGFIACLPSKNIIHGAKVASYFRRGSEFGINLDGFTIDMSGVRERKRKMVRALNEMYLENYRNTGAEFLLGTGKFIAPRTVEVAFADGTIRRLRGTNVIVSTGTRRMWPIRNLGPLTDAYSLTSDWDNQWLTGGLEPDVIAEAHLDAGSIFAGSDVRANRTQIDGLE